MWFKTAYLNEIKTFEDTAFSEFTKNCKAFAFWVCFQAPASEYACPGAPERWKGIISKNELYCFRWTVWRIETGT